MIGLKDVYLESAGHMLAAAGHSQENSRIFPSLLFYPVTANAIRDSNVYNVATSVTTIYIFYNHFRGVAHTSYLRSTCHGK